MSALANEALIEVRDLGVTFALKSGFLKGRSRHELQAAHAISFDIERGRTLGLVGESGSGKTTIGRAILRAIDPTTGTVTFRGSGRPIRIDRLEGSELRRFRPRMSLVFQDPYASLNPRMTVRDIIAEPLVASGLATDRAEIDERVRDIARRCKLNLEHLRRFPHAFSGGQRQRICIARALVSKPDFVVCDESVSALDVSIQAEIINLLQDLQSELGVSFLFIAHDLGVVAQVSHKVAVLYVGRLMEMAPTASLFFRPRHPYTHALLSAIPRIDPEAGFEPIKLKGEIPNPLNAPRGCRFHTRCPFARAACGEHEPEWREIESGHFVACHFAEEFDFSRPRTVRPG